MNKTSRFLFVLTLVCAMFLSICVSAFADTATPTLTLPASLTKIGVEAFKGDTSLDTVIIPSGVTEIPRGAFAGSSLKTIYIPASVTRIADDAFAGTYPLYVETPTRNYTLAEIAVGSSRASINYGGDYLKFRFKPRESGSYTLNSTGSGDTVCYLLDASENLLASDDDSGDNRNFCLSYDLTAGSLYYYCIEFYSSSATGSVPLTLSYDSIPASAHFRALLIGNDAYSGNPLNGCVNDMKAMAAMLSGLGNSFACIKRSNQTVPQMKSAISSTFAGAASDDVSLFYYSGHGLTDGTTAGTNSDNGALCGVDHSYFYMSDLASELSKIPGRVIVLLDSCRSGAAIGKGEREAQAELDAFNQSVIDAFSAYDTTFIDTGNAENARYGELAKSKFIVITACKASQDSSIGPNSGQSVFTYCFIKGCGCSYGYGTCSGTMPADTNGDNKLTVYEIYSYTKNQASSYEPDQTAQYYAADRSEVIFWR